MDKWSFKSKLYSLLGQCVPFPKRSSLVMLPDCWLGGRGSRSELPWVTSSLNAVWLSWASVLAGVLLIVPGSLRKVSCVHVHQWHPPDSTPVGVAFCGLLNAIPSPLLLCGLSGHLCVPSATDSAVTECVPSLPLTSLSPYLSLLSMRTSSQKAKTSPPLLLMSPSNSLISGGVFCIFFASHLYFSKEWLLLPSCYWVNSSQGHE